MESACPSAIPVIQQKPMCGSPAIVRKTVCAAAGSEVPYFILQDPETPTCILEGLQLLVRIDEGHWEQSDIDVHRKRLCS